MDQSPIIFNLNQFDNIFPFYILIDTNLHVVSYGKSLRKICIQDEEPVFSKHFQITYPTDIADVENEHLFSALQQHTGELVLLQCVAADNITLRGQFEYLADSNKILFIGSPMFDTAAEMRKSKLRMKDFAVHNPMVDLLRALDKREKAANELQALVTHRVDTGTESQALQDPLSLLASTNENGVVYTDIAGKITWANESFCKKTGYTLREMIGRTPVQLWVGRQTNRRVLKRMVVDFRNGNNVNGELYIQRKDKSWFWVDLKIQPFTDSVQNTKGFFSIIIDITDRKLNEEKLLQSQTILSSLIGNNENGMLIVDGEDNVVLTNQIFCDMLSTGQSPAKLIGKKGNSVIESCIDVFKKPDELIHTIHTIFKSKQRTAVDNLETTDGRFILLTYIPIIVNGKHHGHLWRYVDTTSRKNYERRLKTQEQKYRGIITNMRLGLLERDQAGIVHFVNQSFCDISGYTEEELVGKQTRDIFISPENERYAKEVSVLRQVGDLKTYQIPIRNKQGELRWWLISGGPSYNLAGELTGNIDIILDITEDKKLEHELELAKEKAEQSSKAKESFLANMSHEIRTPLNAILGFIRQLSREDLPIRQRNYINNTQTAAQHLLSIINNILDMSKIGAGELELESRNFSLYRMIDETASILRNAAKEKLLDLDVIIDDNIAPYYIGDDARIRQICINVVGNAIKFTEKGKVTITCKAEDTIDGIQTILISIADTGIGMDEEYQKQIFNKFSQEDKSIARKYGGTGLGMAISYELIQLIGGTIDVFSKKGEGTRMDIRLPLLIGDKEAIIEVSSDKSFEYLAGLKILVVEDNEMNRLVANMTLSHHRIHVSEAVNGLDAIEKVKANVYDIILMDLQMPLMDGIEATKFIRNELKIRTPIIALTANAVIKEIDQCLSAGMNDYVIKPFEEKTLLRTILKQVEEKSTPAPVEKLYSLDKLNELGYGDKQFVRTILKLFVEQIPTTMDAMLNAYKSEDFKTIYQSIHRIKPTLLDLQIKGAEDKIKYIERLAKDNMDSVQLSSDIEWLDNMLKKVVDSIKTTEL